MRFIFTCFIALSISSVTHAQDVSALPLTPFPAKIQDTSKALVVYISGDGGLNSFSKDFAQQISDKGYPVILFNSLKYFWSKKTPEQTAADVQKTISSYKSQWRRSKIILVGYSFGADVFPFVYTRLPKQTQFNVKHMVLISPSNSTDFEVHVKQLFGKGENNGVSVPAEINKVDKPILIVQAEKETDVVQPASLKVRNYKFITLKGGHHYEHNAAEVANVVLQNF